MSGNIILKKIKRPGRRKARHVKHSPSLASGRLAFDRLSARSFDENGFMRVGGSKLSKETVNPYYGREIPGWKELGLDPEAVYYGYRSGEELEKSLSTWAGLPLMLEHHVDSADRPQKEARVGAVGTDVQWQAPYLTASLTVWDAEAQRAIESGEFRELSCAYAFTPDFSPGRFGGADYDFVMREIKGNHVALVRQGRAGPEVMVADAEPPLSRKEFMKLFNRFKGLLADSEKLSPDESLENEKHTAAGDQAETGAELLALLEGLEDQELAARIKKLLTDLGFEIQEFQDEASGGLPVPEKSEPALDAAAIERAAAARSLAGFKAMNEAAYLARPILGLIDPLAFDTAGEIYKAALEQSGYQPAKYHPSAWAGMVEVIAREQRAESGGPAAVELDEAFAGLRRIDIR